MAKQTQDPMERALARAEKDGVRVVADFGDSWRVRGSDGMTLYRVALVNEDEMTCSCKTKPGVLCKHVAVCVQRMHEQQAEREQPVVAVEAHAPAATVDLAAWDRYYAELHAINQRAMLETAAAQVAQQPGVLAMVAAGMARARVQAEQEARWSRYQDMRASGW